MNAGSEPFEELTDFDMYLDEEDGIEHPEEEPDTSDRVAVFVRADFAVEDIEALRGAAMGEMQSCCPVAPSQDPADWVRSPAQAVGHLLGHHKPVFESDRMDPFGLRLVAETVQTVPLGPPAHEEDDDFMHPWAPLLHLVDEEDNPTSRSDDAT